MPSAGSKRYLRAAAIAVVVLVAIVFMVYTVLRIRITYDLQRQSAEIQASHQRIALWSEVAVRQGEARLDRLERILFGDVIAQLEQKAPKPPPTWVELWQKNRDKELRDRIMSLERRVLQLQQER